jgi:hypothetical protein
VDRQRDPPIVPAKTGAGNAKAVSLTARQLLINRRIAQAALRRATALEARLNGGLTGGDMRAGVISSGQLAPDRRIVSATLDPIPPAATTTKPVPAKVGGKSVRLTSKELLINQRIAQAALRRTNALIARLQAGLSGKDFQDGTITAVNLDPALRS